MIKQNPKITQTELMNILSLTRRGVEWQIKNLKQKNLIKRVGSTRGLGGHWEVIDN
jgi:ATP-dependent DNA helicase RecG